MHVSQATHPAEYELARGIDRRICVVYRPFLVAVPSLACLALLPAPSVHNGIDGS